MSLCSILKRGRPRPYHQKTLGPSKTPGLGFGKTRYPKLPAKHPVVQQSRSGKRQRCMMQQLSHQSEPSYLHYASQPDQPKSARHIRPHKPKRGRRLSKNRAPLFPFSVQRRGKMTEGGVPLHRHGRDVHAGVNQQRRRAHFPYIRITSHRIMHVCETNRD